MGRGIRITDEVFTELCRRIAVGRSLRSVCKAKDMPTVSAVYQALAKLPKEHPWLAQYARAMEDRCDAMAEDILRIADTPVAGVIEKMEPRPKFENGAVVRDAKGEVVMELAVVERRVEDMLAHRKLQIDTRRWLMGKMKPKKYGDKLELAGDPNAPLQVNVVKFTDAPSSS